MKLIEAIKKVKNQGKNPLIAEIKVKSPRDGDLLKGRDPVEVASQYVLGGAAAISVVTEKEYFGGSVEILKKIRGEVSLPLLRKDFIRTKEQVKESKEVGVDAILLIVSILSKRELMVLYNYAHSLGMETVIEIHTEKEMNIVRTLNPQIVGINNKNILKLEKGENVIHPTLSLFSLIPKNIICVSESGIRNVKEAEILIKSGVDALLMGTMLLQAKDILKQVKEIVWLK